MLHVLVLTALSALLLSPGLISGPSLDAAVFMQVAERMRDGATLYAGSGTTSRLGSTSCWSWAKVCSP